MHTFSLQQWQRRRVRRGFDLPRWCRSSPSVACRPGACRPSGPAPLSTDQHRRKLSSPLQTCCAKKNGERAVNSRKEADGLRTIHRRSIRLNLKRGQHNSHTAVKVYFIHTWKNLVQSITWMPYSVGPPARCWGGGTNPIERRAPLMAAVQQQVAVVVFKSRIVHSV